MDDVNNKKFNLLPQTKLGKFAFGLGIFTLIILLLALINSGLINPMSDNLLGFLVFLGTLAALVAFVLGLIAIFKQKERALLVYLMSALGLATFAWLIVMIIKDIVK
ncbi:MAG TPA: hypothetical protein PKI51_03720 [Anaerolineaceae bacterium]|jgi:hypothetical protein|nr:hypothetical protein [Anaerolineaceae bacterium]HNZ15092.1 hypothetical protein [Anaerolineaceae bacterium]HQL92051.1 hypothetical protein [Anaerolineaceae bacterium]